MPTLCLQVYRLITCGTVEEKIYRRQVFKSGLSRTSLQDGTQFRYFGRDELRDLFQVDPAELITSSTQAQLHALHAHARGASPQLAAHIRELEALEGCAGLPVIRICAYACTCSR